MGRVRKKDREGHEFTRATSVPTRNAASAAGVRAQIICCSRSPPNGASGDLTLRLDAQTFPQKDQNVRYPFARK